MRNTPKPKMVNVRAGDGLKVYFPLSVKAAPGRRTFILEGDVMVEVPLDTRFVKRRIHVGDLVVVKTARAAPAMPKKETKPETVAADLGSKR